MNYYSIDRNTAPKHQHQQHHQPISGSGCCDWMSLDKESFHSNSIGERDHEPVSPTSPASKELGFYMSPNCVIDATNFNEDNERVIRKKSKPSIPSFVGLSLLPQVPLKFQSNSSQSLSLHLDSSSHHPLDRDVDESFVVEDEQEIVVPPPQPKKKKLLRFVLPNETKNKKSTEEDDDDDVTLDSSDSDSSDSDAWWYPEEQEQQQESAAAQQQEEQPVVDEDEDESSSYWYSKSDIVEFHGQAKEQVNRFRRQHKEWIRTFIDDISFLDPTSNKKKKKKKPLSLKQLLKVHRPPQDYNAVRGLHIDTCLVAHRRLHCQRVLLIQEKLKQASANQQQTEEQREFILKSTSLQTSKQSKTLARWFAHYDYMDMISSIKQELSA